MQEVTFKWTESRTRWATISLPDDLTPEEVQAETDRFSLRSSVTDTGSITSGIREVSHSEIAPN